jgi:hypothetical protein
MLFCMSTGRVVALTNLGERRRVVDLSAELPDDAAVLEVFANRTYGDEPALDALAVDGLGYRWFRLR